MVANTATAVGEAVVNTGAKVANATTPAPAPSEEPAAAAPAGATGGNETPTPKCTANKIRNKDIESLYCVGNTVLDYNATSKLVHPDKNLDCKDEANEKMQKLNNKKDECNDKFERWNDPELQKHITNIKTKMEKIINRLSDFWGQVGNRTDPYTYDRFKKTLEGWDEDYESEFNYLQEIFASILKEINNLGLPDETKEDIRYIQNELTIIDNFVFKNIPPPQQTQTQTGGNNLQNMTYQSLSCNKNFTTSKLKGGSNSNLENFITKISQNLNENSNPNNINVAISKLQLMYVLENKHYRTLIQKYSKLSDSYNKLIKLEKLIKLPITSKPAILTMIDKLFINYNFK